GALLEGPLEPAVLGVAQGALREAGAVRGVQRDADHPRRDLEGVVAGRLHRVLLGEAVPGGADARGLAQVGADVLLGGEGLAALVGGDLVLALGVEGAGERLALRLAGAAGLRGAHLRLELPVRGLRGEAGELPRAGVHLPQEVPVRGRVPLIESSWLPKTLYQGMSRPGLVWVVMAPASSSGSCGNPASA